MDSRQRSLPDRRPMPCRDLRAVIPWSCNLPMGLPIIYWSLYNDGGTGIPLEPLRRLDASPTRTGFAKDDLERKGD